MYVFKILFLYILKVSLIENIVLSLLSMVYPVMIQGKLLVIQFVDHGFNLEINSHLSGIGGTSV